MKLNTFYCETHKSKPIKHVCLESTTSDLLFCEECSIPTTKQSSLLDLEAYFKIVIEHYTVNSALLTDDEIEEIPEDLQKLVKEKNGNVVSLHQRTYKLKQKVNETFDGLIQKTIELTKKLLNEEKDRILKILDQQAPNLVFNYESYISKIQKFYSGTPRFDPQKLLEKIKNHTETKCLKELIQQINLDIDENNSILNCGQKNRSNVIQTQKKRLGAHLPDIKNENARSPTVTLSDDSSSEAFTGKISSMLAECLQEFCKVDNYVQKYFLPPMEISSEILKENEKILLSSWVSEYKNPEFQLLYRGSQDGYSAASFHQKCNDRGPTAVIIKSNCGSVFGGFTDIAWRSSGGFKATKNAFVFSIDRKAKYNIAVDGEASAIYNNQSQGPTFGKGYDIYICDNCNTIGNSYSIFPRSYKVSEEAETGDSDYLVGSSKFTVAEIEVFSV